MKRIQVIVEDWQWEFLRKFAGENGMSELIRACLCYVIARKDLKDVVRADKEMLDFNAHKEMK